VRLEEQEDDIALQLILDEARRVLAQAECAEPNAHVLGRPHEDVLWQPEVAQVRRAPHCRSCIICRLAIDVEFVKVTVAALDKTTVGAPAEGHHAGWALLARQVLLVGEGEAHVRLPHARALQLEVICVHVPNLLAPLLHFQTGHMHLQRALHRLLFLEAAERHT